MIGNKKARIGLILLLVFVVSLFALVLFFKEPVTSYLDEQFLNPDSNKSSAFTLPIPSSVQVKNITNKEVPVIINQQDNFITQKYPYLLNGELNYIVFTTSKNISSYYKEATRSISYTTIPPTTKDFILKNIDDKSQYDLLKPFIDEIKKQSNNPLDQARIAISLVQHIPYDIQAYTSSALYGRYAYEVLHDALGVCGEKSELLALLLQDLGFGVAIFNFEKENHQAIGISCSLNMSYKQTGFCFVETTQPTILTNVPNNYFGVGELTYQPEVIILSQGLSLNNISKEYSDKELLLELQKRGPILEMSDYNKWVDLVNYYGLLV
jgi:hypothetical protein